MRFWQTAVAATVLLASSKVWDAFKTSDVPGKDIKGPVVVGNSVCVAGSVTIDHKKLNGTGLKNALNCSRNNDYTIVGVDASKVEDAPSYLVFDNQTKECYRYMPFSTANNASPVVENILSATFNNYTGVTDDILDGPQAVALDDEDGDDGADIVTGSIPAVEDVLQVPETEEDVIHVPWRFKHRFRHSMTPNEAGKLSFSYDYFTPQNKKDVKKATEYVRDLFESNVDDAEVISYLTNFDRVIAPCLRTKWGKGCDVRMVDYLRRIDEIFEAAPPLNEDLVVYRTTVGLLPTKDASYTFTSPNIAFTQRFWMTKMPAGGDDTFYMLKITIPKGARMLSLGFYTYPMDVDEIILPRGGKFQINGIEDSEHTTDWGLTIPIKIVDLHYLPQEVLPITTPPHDPSEYGRRSWTRINW